LASESRSARRWLVRLRLRLQETLFLDAPPRPPLTPARVGAGLALAAVGVVAICLRLGFSTSFHSLWAEDGTILLETAVRHDFLTSAGTLYVGNVILVPRLVGEIAAAAPLSWAPAIFTIAGNAIVVGCAFIVWTASAAHIRDPFLRAALAALVVIVPVAGLESIDNTDYVAFYMLFATFWLLLWRPRSAVAAGAGGAFGLLTALCTPLGAVLVPLAALRMIAARDRRDWLVVAPLVAGAVAQLVIYEFHRSAAPPSGWDWSTFEAYLQRVLAGGLFGQRIAGGLWEIGGWVFLAILGMTAAALAAFALGRPSRRGRDFLILALILSLGTFVVSAYARDVGGAMVWPAGSYNSTTGPRYAIMPVLLLVSAVLVQLDLGPARERPRVQIACSAGFLALLVAGAVTSFSVADREARGTPSWPSALAAARQSCAPPQAPTATIPISPPGWTTTLPCSEVRAN
jgi:hypothetical protein